MKKTLTTLIVLFALLLATFAIADYSIIDSATGAYIKWDGTKYIFYDGSKNLMDLSDTEFDVSNVEQNLSGNTGYGMLKLYNGQGIGNGFSRIMWLETPSGVGTMRFTVPSGGVDTGAMLLKNDSLTLYTGIFDLYMDESPWSQILSISNGNLKFRENGTIMFEVQDGTIDLSGMVNNPKIKYDGNNYFEFDKGTEGVRWYLSGANVMNLDYSGNLTIAGEFNSAGISDGIGKAVCINSDGNLGTCTDAVNATGHCTCT